MHSSLGIETILEDYVHNAYCQKFFISLSKIIHVILSDYISLFISRSRHDMDIYKIINHQHDAIVIGAGGSGLRATMGLAQSKHSVACISRVFLEAML